MRILPARVLIVDDAPRVPGGRARTAGAARLHRRRRGRQRGVGARGPRAAAPDAVLVDIRLPDGDGFELAAALTRADPELAVLLASADRETPSPARVQASGARGFVLKTRLAATDLEQFLPSS